MSVQGGRLRRSRTHFAVVVLCLALSYVLGVSNLKSYPIVGAELNSIKHLWSSQSGPTNSIPETVESVFTYSSVHAPGYMILLNLWSRLTGRDLFTLRLLSVFFSLFALVLTYRLALLTRSADTATVAALIVASLAFIVYYSYTVRMYSLLAMATAWVAWSYWKITSIGDPVPRRYGMNFILARLGNSVGALFWVDSARGRWFLPYFLRAENQTMDSNLPGVDGGRSAVPAVVAVFFGGDSGQKRSRSLE